MSPVARPMSSSEDLYIGAREAARRSGRSVPFIMRAAILRRVRVKLDPGVPPMYSAADVDILATRAQR
jgi:hypothetical protein